MDLNVYRPIRNRIDHPCKICGDYIQYGDIAYLKDEGKVVICASCRHGGIRNVDHIVEFLDDLITFED